MSDIYNSNGTALQKDFDNYNLFLFGNNKHIFFKLATRIELFNKIRDIHGDIIECGVFKGAGMMVWLRMLDTFTPHDTRKVIGFDYFESEFLDTLNNYDRDNMSQVLNRSNTEERKLEHINNQILSAGFGSNKFELIRGDVSETTKIYLLSRPGFRVSLLYLDVDLEEPTYNALVNLWDRIVPGGIVVFDEYAYHVWSESNAVDKFIKEKNLKLHKLNVPAPTAYIVKTD